MKYIEGMDYWVRHVQFPNMASESVVLSHGDGTYTIYINTLFPEEKQAERLHHEVRHLEQEHFYREELTIREVERSADGLHGHSGDTRILPGTPPITVIRHPDQPLDVSFGFRVPDDSLLPRFQPGELLWCDDRPLITGDVGLFQYRGETLCRQYREDAFGITYLFALNRARSREDVLVPAADRRGLRCLGRVRTARPIPLPGE